MSALDTLARVARREAEEIERALAALEGRRRMVHSRIEAHDRGVQSERALGAASAEAAMAFGAFAQLALQQRKVLVAEEAALADEAEALRDTLREAFIELKKVETLIEREAERALAEANKQEQIAMDDVAANMMRRRG